MQTAFRPMLAAEYDPEIGINFPALVSPKLDGIRCVMRNGQPLTRSLKPIPNRHIRAALHGLPDFDGELIVGDPTNPLTWNTTSSAVMTHDGELDFTYYVFDMSAGDATPFEARTRTAKTRAGMYGPNVRYLHHHRVDSIEQLMTAEEEYTRAGYEGLMIRSLTGPYKFGRSTAREGHLLKMKRFDDLEASVVAIQEGKMHIGGATVNALGLQERDHKQENFTETGALGALVCQIAGSSGTECIQFSVGSGFTAEQRENLWKEDLIGKIAKVKHQGWTVEGKPRFPIFLGFRDEKDMG